MATTGHETEAINVQDLKATLKKGGNKGLFNEATVSTAAATAAKVTGTTPASFSLVSGATIILKFTYGNTADNATLQVGDGAAKAIYYRGSALTAGIIKAGDKIVLRYNGTQWDVIGHLVVADESLQAASAGTDLSLVTTGEKFLWNSNADKVNTLNRRTRLTDFDLNTLKLAVVEQDLEKYGLRVGDEKTINGYTYVIAGLNPMKGTATPYRVAENHVGLIVIPHTTQKWNTSGNTYQSTNTHSTDGTWTTGASAAGYANSDLHYYLTNTVLSHVQNDLGAANLLAHSKRYTNAVNTSGYNRFNDASGCSSSWAWYANQYICALSEIQVYGSIVWSSSGHDTGEACRQLDVFRHYNMNEIFGGEHPWLRDVVSASHVALVYDNGSATHSTVSYGYYVAALILFK